MIRLLLVEDSVTVREFFADALLKDGGIEIIGFATNGEDALTKVKNLNPDVVLMDINMPIMDGLEATRIIMQEWPVPVVIMSSTSAVEEVELAMEAFGAGALSLIRKPLGKDAQGSEMEEFLNNVKAMAGVQVVRHRKRSTSRDSRSKTLDGRAISNGIEVIGIAASTGGPAALANILSTLPKDFPIPILIVQHIVKGFTQGLVNWLDELSVLKVKIASDGEVIRKGHVYLASEDFQLGVDSKKKIALSDAPIISAFKPSANFLFESLALVYGKQALGVILSGMGSDGVEGLKLMHKAGARVIAQDETSCVVYGMPKVALEAGVVSSVVELSQISKYLQENLVGKGV